MVGVEGGHAIEHSLDNLREYRRRGAIYMTLTHNGTHDWADASYDKAQHGGLNAFGEEVVLEMNRLTSAVPTGFLLLVPLNITSAICPLRRLLTLCSPSTHFTASTILLLPQPFGPTITVTRESKRNSAVANSWNNS